VIQDFTYDYFTKYLQHKKLLSKKKVEKNLASLINSITNKNVDESKNFDPKAQMEKMKLNMLKPARTFKLPYQITASSFYNTDEERQYLAVGLIDGAIVVLDLALGLEKYFIEKHPAAVSSLAFFEEKVLMSGSIDGNVNLCDLESEN
jgi:WD40 repeat protein